MNTTAGAGGEGFVFAKFSGPLPIGTAVSMAADAGYFTVQAPTNTTVAANNTLFHWIVTINAPAYRSPYTSDYTSNESTTNFSNGQNITTTPATGTNTGAGSTTVVNAGTLPTTGQTTTIPTGVTAGTTGSTGTPGTTVITGTGAGTSGALDSGLLSQIANNTSEIAKNTKDLGNGGDASGLPTDAPADTKLDGRFQPDAATQNAVGGMNPIAGKSIPTGVAPSITLPFATLDDNLQDKTLSFDKTEFAPWISGIRVFLLFCVSGIFIYWHIKLISKTLSSV